jgi:hypothetical protein
MHGDLYALELLVDADRKAQLSQAELKTWRTRARLERAKAFASNRPS